MGNIDWTGFPLAPEPKKPQEAVEQDHEAEMLKDYPTAHPLATKLHTACGDSDYDSPYIAVDDDETLLLDGHFKIADLRKVFGQ